MIWAGGDIDRVAVSLRVIGDDLDPAVVSNLLACPPTKAYCKGDALPGRSRRVARTGVWILRGVDDSPGGIDEKIGRLLDRVSSDSAAWTALAPYRKDVFCGLFLNQWNRGGWLSPELMQRLAERGLRLELDIYGAEEGDE